MRKPQKRWECEINGKIFPTRREALTWREVIISDTGRIAPHTTSGKFSLYKIKNFLNKKIYVGITTGAIAQRLNNHKVSAKKNEPSRLYDAFRKYGSENFTIALIRDDAKNWFELEQQEIEEIAKLKSNEHRYGYNISPGGSLGTPSPFEINGMIFPSKIAVANYFNIDPKKQKTNKLIKINFN